MPIKGAKAVFSGPVGDAILSADAASLFVSSGNEVVQIDVATGSELARYSLGSRAAALDVSADGKYLAVVEPDLGDRFALINLVTGTVSQRTVSTVPGASIGLRDVSFTGNKALLLSRDVGAVLRYDLATKTATDAITGASRPTLISSDDRTHTYVLDSSFFHRTVLYAADGGVEAVHTTFPDPYAGASLPTVMKPIGAITRDGSTVFEGEDGVLRDGTLAPLATIGGGAGGYAFSPSGGELYSIAADGNILVRDVATGEIETVYFVNLPLKPDDPLFIADQATLYGNVLQITDNGRYALAIGSTGVWRYDLQKLAPMSTQGDDVITAGNTLYGLGGNDTLGGPGFQTLIGGKGDDTYLLDQGERAIEAPDSGADTVQTAAAYFSLPANFENITSTALAGVTTYLEGNQDDNVILGGAGNDTIDGRGGVDVLAGGAGRDTLTFLGQSAGGITVSLAIAGVQATPEGGSVRIRGFENLTGSQLDDVLTGDGGANTLEGWAGKDRLDGGAGADKMDGGNDDDIYVVDNRGDVVSENSGNGIDTVRASVNYVLPDGIENLQLTGNRNLSGTGNSADNRITGNDGNNLLDGSDGKDVLAGGAGDDTLVGSDTETYVYIGYGDDTLKGGAGNDTVTYAAAYGGVTVSLRLAGAQDTGSAGKDTLAGIENLVGTAFDDRLTGDDGANQLRGGMGDDLLAGGLGDDALIGWTGLDTVSYADVVGDITVDLALAGPQDTRGAGLDTLSAIENLIGGQGSDRLLGTDGANRIEGGTGIDRIAGRGGNDTLDGGIGEDILFGGSGNDTYVVDNRFDTVSEAVSRPGAAPLDAGGRDRVLASASFSLATGGARFVEDLALTGSDAIGGKGNALANGLTGNDAANRLDGGLGDDVLRGGAGDDVLLGGAGSDRLFGEGGADRFEWTSTADFGGETSETADRIADFSAADGDKIVLTGVDAQAASADTNEAFAFVGTAEFSGAAGELRAWQADGATWLAGDADGDKAADFLIKLAGLVTLSAADLLL